MATRKAHIIRIYKDNDPDTDQWVDVERLDELAFESGSGYQYRKKVWRFKWDDFNPDDPKTSTKKKIVDPNDKDNFIEVPVRKSVFVTEARGGQFQGSKYSFVNDVSNRNRQTHSRRIYHHDIADKYLDGGQPPSDPEDYLRALGDQDQAQYVDVELLDKYGTNQNENRDAQGKSKAATWQKKKWIPDTKNDPLLNDPILDTDEVDPDFVPTNNPEDGPEVDPPWRLDPLQNIVNVNWGLLYGFLYSGGDGMFGSSGGSPTSGDDEEPKWEEAPSSVPATSLAWIDNVWVGCSTDGCWRSEDGAKTWEEVEGEYFRQVVAMKPAGVDDEGKPLPGMFCGWRRGDDFEEIYISSDLGLTFNLALSIPYTFGEDGDESVNSISGCGGLFFISTVRRATRDHGSEAYCYTSTADGTGFGGGEMVFGPGSYDGPPSYSFPRIAYNSSGVGYDSKTERYIYTGVRVQSPTSGVQNSLGIYTIGSGGSFSSGGGNVYAFMSSPNQLSSAPSAVGGDGEFATGYYEDTYSGGGGTASSSVRAVFLPSGSSSEILQTGPNRTIGSFCFNPRTEDGGIFACVASDSANEGGVYIARVGEGWRNVHSGSVPGAVAVGKLSWLGGK